jgi:hypothetical protein
MDNAHVVCRPHPTLPAEQARDTRARAWKFIFDTYLKKAAGQDNAKTKKSLNTEEGGPHDLEEDFFVRQKV